MGGGEGSLRIKKICIIVYKGIDKLNYRWIKARLTF